MRLTVSLEGNAEGRVLASVDMEEIVKMAITDDIKKSNFNPEMFKACTDASYRCGYIQGRADVIDTIKELVKQLSNKGYRDIDGDWVDASCNTENLLEKLEQMKGAEMADNDSMDFPKTFKEFLNEYSFIDKEEVYTNKNELIQTFRVEQGYEHFEKIIREDEKEKAIDEFIDVVLNRHILTKDNKEALKFILEYAKKDMLKNSVTCKDCVNYDKTKVRQCICYNNECKPNEDATHCCEFIGRKDEGTFTCKDCTKYGDLHSSCSLARDLKLDEDSPICENFKRKCTS